MRNVTPVSDVYKAVPTSFFWAPNRHNKLLKIPGWKENHF